MAMKVDTLWATEQEEAEVDVSFLLGKESKAGDAANEAAAALKNTGSGIGDEKPYKKHQNGYKYHHKPY